MRARGRWFVAATALVNAWSEHSPASAAPPGWKAQELPAAEERRWIEAVKNRPTADGATVAQVVAYVQTLRPVRFKVSGYTVLFDSNGKPSSVAIQYWIGAKRLEGDAYSDLSYEVRSSDTGLTLVRDDKDPSFRFSTLHAVEQGRDAFIRYIDDLYEQTCVDATTRAKLC